MTTKTLSVSAIANGSVIDHVLPGLGLRVMQLLNVSPSPCQITLGVNLKSQSYRQKDLIKIEDKELSDKERSYISVLSPRATFSIIQNYEVIQKYRANIPPMVSGPFICLNPSCITQTEQTAHLFSTKVVHRQIGLTCQYCEKTYSEKNIGLIYDSLSQSV